MTATAAPPTPPAATGERFDPLAGLLSYAVPGLGQLVQGRVGKGLLFFLAVHGLFFYGMMLGHGKNVYLPHASPHKTGIGRVMSDLYARIHFAGQVFVGAAAWPAIYQYVNYDPILPNGGDKNFLGDFEREPSAEEINFYQREQNKTWDVAWVYTVIAGVLNMLVVYDAVAGPAMRYRPEAVTEKPA